MIGRVVIPALAAFTLAVATPPPHTPTHRTEKPTVNRDVAHDVSKPLSSYSPARSAHDFNRRRINNSADVEQRAPGTKPAATLVESFDGLGAGFEGPQGTARFNNPSD